VTRHVAIFRAVYDAARFGTFRAAFIAFFVRSGDRS
jgi:hypothetical protein